MKHEFRFDKQGVLQFISYQQITLQLNYYFLFGLTWLNIFIFMNAQAQSIQVAAQSAQPILDVTTSPAQELAIEQQSQLYLYIIGFVILVIVVVGFLRRKAKPSKRQIGLVGERGSGKTQLFIGLCGGKSFETVPSITNNTSTLEIGGKTYKICDFIGDNVSKQEVVSELPRFHTIVHVVDGSDSKKLSDAALFIYRVLVNKIYQKDPCNYILFLNKDDEKGFHGVEKLVKRIEDEVQTIKSSKKNLSEDNQGEEDYLRIDRTRFSLKAQGIVVNSGSAKSNRKKLLQQLEQLCA